MMRFEAAIHQSKKDYDNALALFEKAETLVPTGSGAVELSVGAKLFDLQQYDSAVPHLEQAYRTGDRFARVDAAAKLAEIYFSGPLNLFFRFRSAHVADSAVGQSAFCDLHTRENFQRNSRFRCCIRIFGAF